MDGYYYKHYIKCLMITIGDSVFKSNIRVEIQIQIDRMKKQNIIANCIYLFFIFQNKQL